MPTCSPPDATTLVQDDAHWAQLVARLPDDLAQTVFTQGAILRKRQIVSAAQLLRLILAYACNLPLTVVAGWAAALGIATLTEEALDQRLRHAQAWLASLLTQVLAQRAGGLTPLGQQLRLRIIDGTQVARPGATGTDWRIHLTYDLQRLRLDRIELTEAQQAEALSRSAPQPGDLVVGDRYYGTRANVLAVVLAQAHVLVRIGWNAFPLLMDTGQVFPLFAHLRTIAHGTQHAWDVQMKPSRRSDPPVTGRLVASRLPADAAAAARARVRKQHQKTAKKNAHGHPAQLQPETLEAAEYLLLFTTVPATWASAAQLVALYRFRWQIELAIKRLKSILGLAHLTARHTALCRAVLLAKLLLAVLVDDLCANAEAFSPLPGAGRSAPAPAQLVGPHPARVGNAPGRYPRGDPAHHLGEAAAGMARVLSRGPADAM